MRNGTGAHGRTLLREASLQLADGRALAYAEWGAPNGVPVLLFHGSPDTHVFCPDNYPVDTTTAEAGVRLVTVSRPGYSGSTNQPGRTLLGWADDVAQFADALQLDRFALIGVSGGGPFALACAVRLAERIPHLTLVSTGGPLDEVPGDRDVLPEQKRELTALTRTDPDRAVEILAEESQWLVDAPEAAGDPSGWPESDRWIVEDPQTREVVISETREAGRAGPFGHVWDRMCFGREWGFDPAAIRVPTNVWHGELDEIVPPRHFVYFALTIPEATATLWPGMGHTAMLRGSRWGEVLAAAKAGMRSPDGIG